MRLSSAVITACLCLAGTAAAQFMQIAAPPNGTVVQRGQGLLVEVARPHTMESSIEVGIVISLLSCPFYPNDICPPPVEVAGLFLYNGPWNPELPDPNPYHLLPHENFTVTIPADTPTGKAQLAVTHFYFTGAGPHPGIGVLNITLDVE